MHGFNINSNIHGTFKAGMNWDEEDRLRTVKIGNRAMQHYMYSHGGERVVKASSQISAVYNNGMIISTHVVLENPTLYPSQFVTVQPNLTYTKHYYIGDQRVVSRLGEDILGKHARQESLQDPVLLTLPVRQDIALQQYVREYENTTLEIAPPIVEDTNRTVSAQGYPAIYYYHSDHLATTNFVTSTSGRPSQFYINLPFGETFAEQRNPDPAVNMYQSPYLFNGKELDEETSLYYYGARYMQPILSMWLSPDPMAEKYPNVNPYAYCLQNPVKFVDPDGRDIDPATEGNVSKYVDPKSKHYNAGFAEKYEILKNDKNAVYSFNYKEKGWREDGRKTYGNVSYNGTSEKGQYQIGINYTDNTGSSGLSKQSPLLEETAHAAQFSQGQFGFLANGGTFALDIYDEADAKLFAAQNTNSPKFGLEKSLLKSFESGGIDGVADFLKERPSMIQYIDMYGERENVEKHLNIMGNSNRQPYFRQNGQSNLKGFIMQRP